MLLRLLAVAAVACGGADVAASPTANTCNASSPAQSWSYSAATGFLVSGTSSLCLTSAGDPSQDGTSLRMAACGSVPASRQAFDLIAGFFVVARAAQTKCVNIEAYGTSPGSSVWLYGCIGAGYSCQGNCDWHAAPASAPGASIYVNSESGLCLDDGTGPTIPRSCSPGSVSAALPFCDTALSFEARAADLVSRLPLAYKLALIMLPFPVAPSALAYPPLDIAAFFWDATMIHGMSFFTPGTYDASETYTSFPHAIAQAASWDVELVARVTRATAYEARAVSQQVYNETGGLIIQSLMAEGGPLANSAHDPRWGRTMETVRGRRATRGVQLRGAGWASGGAATRDALRAPWRGIRHA